MSNPSIQLSQLSQANIVAIAAVIGAPYIAMRRHLDDRSRRLGKTSEKVDDGQKKASNDSKKEAQAGGRSVPEIPREDSRELAELRDAVI